MNRPQAAHACEKEINELHAFFVAWFRGRLPDSDEAWSRVTDALDDDFHLVSPDGRVQVRASLLAQIRGRYGQIESTVDYAIWTQGVQVLFADMDHVLVMYEEWQRIDGKERGRRSTALLSFDSRGPNGLRWRHVHETWMAPEGDAPDEAAS